VWRGYGQLVSRIWPLARKYGFDALLVIAAIESTLELVLRQDAAEAPTTTLWLCVPALALVPLALLARRRFPFAAPAALWLLAAALSFVDGRLVTFSVSTFAAGLVAALLLGNLRDENQARVGLAIVVAGAVSVVYNDPTHSGGEFIFTPLVFVIAWLAGFALHERAEQAEAAEVRATQAELAARIAVAEERARIARELHDIVAHAMSVMVLQVGALRHKADPEEREVLEGIEDTGRTALAEMRRLLGAMRREGDDLELAPQPGMERIEPLLEEIRRAGLPVELHVEGEPFPLSQAIDLSAYRIVQEGLTNTLKHAHAHQADVTIRYGAADVQIEVRDDGSGASAGDGLGHGLVGIRERVKIYGGEMSAGRANGGGFVLSARLPLRP
jgi:signal transduction histidine kinase